jgi:hypothetical protein
MVMTALTSGGNTSSGTAVAVTSAVGGSVAGGSVAVGAAVAGGSVGAGGDPAHALNTRLSNTIRLKRAETFLDIRFFSCDTFENRMELDVRLGKMNYSYLNQSPPSRTVSADQDDNRANE